MTTNYYLNATDVATYMGISIPTAYKIMQKLNKELSKNGYVTVAGRVPKTFFLEKTYGGISHGVER